MQKLNIELLQEEILEHDVIKYFDYEVTKSDNASYAHNNGFFVGNSHKDMTEEIDLLEKTLKNI